MKVIGITGGIASGKSHVLAKVKSMGAFVLDCDSIVRELSRPGFPLHTAIIKEFGEEYLKDDGTINKSKLRETVFTSDVDLERLNEVSKGIILTNIKRELKQAKDYEIVFVEGIRIFEDGFRDMFDRVWFVHCTETEQLRRIMERDQILFGQAMEVVSRQRELQKYMDKADVIINTDCDIPVLLKKIEKLYVELNK